MSALAPAMRIPASARPDGDIRFAGYAALFGVRDGGGDLILPGAFAASLGDRRAKFPLLWEHRPEMQLGYIELAHEDQRGLRVIGRITLGTSRPALMVTANALTGLSFGYRTRKFRTLPEGRDLARIDLFEISLVANPLQHGARIHLVA